MPSADARSNVASPLATVPAPADVDHSISYNNAAFFATSGATGLGGLNSSRSSEISRSEAIDLYRFAVFVRFCCAVIQRCYRGQKRTLSRGRPRVCFQKRVNFANRFQLAVREAGSL
ncbi:unnamed protein product [Gongylonema pulchrum]|uniref:Uncharacterized protein n=1 Tax=Gongylonema pulchrum TaxID=637853 RepID=A0A3P6RDG5_9BILA|nr:unnamed protein product [Gongylonema pulchrum]